jgi:hypothetical protein
MPSYVAIAGGCDIDPASSDHQDWPDPSTPQQMYHNRAKGRGPNDSIVTASGLLPVAEHAALDTCPDGTANTLLVAEQSGFLQPVNPGRADNCHGDPGWNVDTDRNPGGWLTGTDATRPVPRIDPNESTQPGDWPVAWLFNVTTVRYSPNRKRVIGDSSTPSVPGCAEVMGHNNPLQSPHVGGLQVVLGDGSAQFISEDVDLAVILRLAIRDDGQSVQLE